MAHMHTYTVVYYGNDGDVHTYTCPATSEEAAAMAASGDLNDTLGEVIHVVRHHAPKVTVVLDGDMVQAAHSDGEVELLHCYADKEAVGNALDNGLSLMPGSRHCINFPEKASHAYPFGWVDVDHNPGAVEFDYSAAQDPGLLEEFTQAVREEFE